MILEISFKRNLSDLDRVIRTIITVIVWGIVIIKPIPINGTWAIILTMIGLFMIAEAVSGY